jgi:hypothetical protein
MLIADIFREVSKYNYTWYIMYYNPRDTHPGEDIAGHCRSEMLEHRQALLDDHGLPPEVLTACSDEVQKYCDPQTGHGVHMLDCLMSHAMPSKNNFDPTKKFSEQCLTQVSTEQQKAINKI